MCSFFQSLHRASEHHLILKFSLCKTNRHPTDGCGIDEAFKDAVEKARRSPSGARSRTLQVSPSCRRLPNLGTQTHTYWSWSELKNFKVSSVSHRFTKYNGAVSRVSAYSACEKDGVESCTGHVITLITGWAYLLAQPSASCSSKILMIFNSGELQKEEQRGGE